MPPKSYRLYCLNERGTIRLAEWVEAESDEEAARKAQEIEHGAVMAELWEQNRLIATLKGGEVNLYPEVDEAPEQLRSLTAQRGAAA